MTARHKFNPEACNQRLEVRKSELVICALQYADEVDRLKRAGEEARRNAEQVQARMQAEAAVNERNAEQKIHAAQAKIDELKAQDPEEHKHANHCESVAPRLRGFGYASYGFAALYVGLGVLSSLAPAMPGHWTDLAFWIVVFGGASLYSFCFYSRVRSLLSPFVCPRCGLILLGILCAIYVPFWALCEHAALLLGGFKNELLITVLGGLTLPEISHALRHRNESFRVPKPKP